MRIITLSTALAAALLARNAGAVTITSTLDDLGSGRYEYGYEVLNDDLAVAIDEFTIFFDLGLYENLAVTASPAGWDSLSVEPDPGLPDDGFFDSCSSIFCFGSGLGITPGTALGGFSVAFDYLGAGLPGSQYFQIVDPLTFGVLGEGFTEPAVSVPEPGTLSLLLAGLFVFVRRKPGTQLRA